MRRAILAAALVALPVLGTATPAEACDSTICRLCPAIDRVIDRVSPHITDCLA